MKKAEKLERERLKKWLLHLTWIPSFKPVYRSLYYLFAAWAAWAGAAAFPERYGLTGHILGLLGGFLAAISPLLILWLLSIGHAAWIWREIANAALGIVLIPCMALAFALAVHASGIASMDWAHAKGIFLVTIAIAAPVGLMMPFL